MLNNAMKYTTGNRSDKPFFPKMQLTKAIAPQNENSSVSRSDYSQSDMAESVAREFASEVAAAQKTDNDFTDN